MKDYSNLKFKLSDYLHIKGIEFKKGFYKCPNPNHNDSTPSCRLYTNADGDLLSCMSACNSNYDIFDVAGLLIGSDDFITQKKEVENTLGIIDTSITPPKPKQTAHANNIHIGKDTAISHKPKEEYISIPIEKIDEVYNDKKILEYAKEKGYGDTITGKYICYDCYGKYTNGVEYRFESTIGKKCVFLVWYNGKTIKWTNPPRLIFGLNEIKPDCPFLIVEGPKTREIASKSLPGFNVLTWNGGANNADKVDWCSVIPNDADVYLWPDDDRERYRKDHPDVSKRGKLWPDEEQPGRKAMEKIKEMLI